MNSSVNVSLYKTICQKIKEGWDAKTFSSYFELTHKKARILIQKVVKYECGDR